ncbi:MAG: hypothetical protein NTY81_00985 [Candidatus Staskawiczbacteria bacterium]|nr:hypothetical protein [Candidatus Staskawiczbacteria bacterium]
MDNQKMGSKIPQTPQKSMPSQPAKQDGSIFGGKPEISRKALEQKMRTDAGVWQAERSAGLNLSPAQRAELIKKDIPQVYGSNVSKTDLNRSIAGLNKKLLGAKTPKEHADIRKEISFFKKIGGIK